MIAMKERPLTHERLREVAMSVLKRSPYRSGKPYRQAGFACSVVLSELVTVVGDIPDAIGWYQGRSVMIECKTSRGDFLADAKKPQRLAGTGMGERRYFMAPKGLLTPTDIPEHWGLLEVDGREISETVSAPRRTLDISGHANEKSMLLSTIRRIRTREFLIIQKEEEDLEYV